MSEIKRVLRTLKVKKKESYFNKKYSKKSPKKQSKSRIIFLLITFQTVDLFICSSRQFCKRNDDSTSDHNNVLFRSRRSLMFFKICVLENFAVFTEKHQACNFMKAKNPAQVFSSDYCKIFKNSFFLIENFRWLLL